MNCKTALQVHWDWAWTMQDVVVENCTNGIVIVGGVCSFFQTNYIQSNLTDASTCQSRLAVRRALGSPLAL